MISLLAVRQQTDHDLFRTEAVLIVRVIPHLRDIHGYLFRLICIGDDKPVLRIAFNYRGISFCEGFFFHIVFKLFAVRILRHSFEGNLPVVGICSAVLCGHLYRTHFLLERPQGNCDAFRTVTVQVVLILPHLGDIYRDSLLLMRIGDRKSVNSIAFH